MKNKTACITGFSGQDGAYCAQMLLNKGYKVYGLVRRLANPNLDFIKDMGLETVELVDFDLADSANINKVIQDIKPDEFYNFGAMSHVGVSFSCPEHTGNVTGLGPLRILHAIKEYSPHTRFYQGSTSELFGDAPSPQNETTPFMPRSPYAVAKCAAHYYVKVYRESYGIYACAGILGNHESPRRSKDFLTRKVTSYVANLYHNPDVLPPLELGQVLSYRDWGYAPEYVEAAWLMLQRNSPKDYVIGTGQTHSVKEFCNLAFKVLNIELEWIGEGEKEIAVDKYHNKKVLITINPKFYRPAEVPLLQMDPSLAERELGWKAKVQLEELVKIMVEADIKRYK